MKPKQGNYWNDKKKVEVVTTYLIVGNASLTAAMSNVPIDTVRKWKATQWWADIVRELQDQENIALSAKLKKIVDKSIDVTLDRLENGDTIFDSRTGKLRKIPIKIREAIRAVDMAMDKRQLLYDKKVKEITNHSVEDRLNKLAEEFAKFSNQNNEKVINGEYCSVSEISEHAT